jgi:hypothetical protein
VILLNILLACEIAGPNGLLIVVYRGILGKKISEGLLDCRTHTPFKLLRSQEPQLYKYKITLTYKLIIKQKYPTHFFLRTNKFGSWMGKTLVLENTNFWVLFRSFILQYTDIIIIIIII